jgi:hypothetical protein
VLNGYALILKGRPTPLLYHLAGRMRIVCMQQWVGASATAAEQNTNH